MTDLPLANQGQRPPGPKGLAGFFEFLKFGADPLGFVEGLHARFPGVARIRMLGQHLIYVTDHDLLNEILLNKGDRYTKDWSTRSLSAVLGDGLFTSEGALWRRQRKRVAPTLKRNQVSAYHEIMVRRVHDTLDEVEPGACVPVRLMMLKLTMSIVAESLFGRHLGAKTEVVTHALDEALEAFETLIYGVGRFLPESWPSRTRRRIRSARDRMREVVLEIIADKRASGAQGDDLICRMLQARDEQGEVMSDTHLCDEAITMLLAGHETTAMAMTFVLHLLWKHPEEAQTLRAELDTVLAGRAPSFADLQNLPRTMAVIKEALRLYPPVWLFGREITEDQVVAGHALLQGDQLLISPWLLHRQAAWFEEPERFWPERWLDGRADQVPRHAYLPFGGGNRVCAGLFFAEMEATIITAMVLQRFNPACEDAYELALSAAITLRPQDDVPMVFHPRQSGD